MVRMIVTASVVLFAGAAMASGARAQDAEAGSKSFGKCRPCHQVGETAKNGIGPTLNGLFGRPAGAVAGYAYSAANKDVGIVWSPEIFAEYIKDPKAKIPGTKMAFAGIRSDAEIADLVAYLRQFDAAGVKTGS